MSSTESSTIPMSYLYSHFLKISQKHNAKPFDANTRYVRAQNLEFALDNIDWAVRYEMSDRRSDDWMKDSIEGIIRPSEGGLFDVVMSDMPLKRDIYGSPYGEKYGITYHKCAPVGDRAKFFADMEAKYISKIKTELLIDSL